MTKEMQIKNLLRCVSLFAATEIFGKPGASFWWKLIKYAHSKGYLYTSFDQDTIDTAMIMYRVKDLKDVEDNNIPETEEGDTLYVLACASKSRDRFKLNKIRNYVTRTNPEVKKIALNHRNNNNDFRIFEVNSGQAKQTVIS